MNFLAHLSLSRGSEERLIGNFLADFLRKHEQRAMPPAYQRGIELHYAIDNFTDQHPAVQAGVARLRKKHRKYAPVVLDVLLDYVLAQNWNTYFPDETLAEFTQRMYRIMEAHLHIMPPRLQERVPNMIRHDWLPSYGTLPGVAYTFERMKTRVSRPEWLEGVVDSLNRDYDLLEQEFHVFYPDIRGFIRFEV